MASSASVGTETATHCPDCALQCGMRLTLDADTVRMVGDGAFPVNKGALCIKGWLAAETLTHPGRLTSPLIRNARGVLMPA